MAGANRTQWNEGVSGFDFLSEVAPFAARPLPIFNHGWREQFWVVIVRGGFMYGR